MSTSKSETPGVLPDEKVTPDIEVNALSVGDSASAEVEVVHVPRRKGLLGVYDSAMFQVRIVLSLYVPFSTFGSVLRIGGILGWITGLRMLPRPRDVQCTFGYGRWRVI